MDFRERQVAQIVRDFLDAYVLAARIRARLEQGDLDFGWIERLVGDVEESALYRLKEECHALFRQDGARTTMELHAGELFDLAVAALFHEGMRFRESFYLTTTYEPQLKRMLAEGSASGPLAEAFRRLFEGGRRRMLESESGVAELFRETRDQLLILLRQMPPSGAVARGLVQNPVRTEEVFEMPLTDVLAEVYGDAEEGFKLAVESLIDNGHFAEAVSLLSVSQLEDLGGSSRAFAEGMAHYYAGEVPAAIHYLSLWISAGAVGRGEWRELARNVLDAVSSNPENPDPALGRSALALVEMLTQRSA
jgi:hypothetical protein